MERAQGATPKNVGGKNRLSGIRMMPAGAEI